MITYVFSNPKDSGYIGGKHSAVVIMKEDGTVSNMPALVYSGPGKEIGLRAI
ncbi:MAG: hypothetical protein KBG42_08775 [Lachnospiraceae bacterium]|nr:hypothetical protein [Lachnospiraceae bacterium]